MTDSSPESGPPVSRVTRRRVRTEPREGQLEEPDFLQKETEVGENDARLKADKPPHY